MVVDVVIEDGCGFLNADEHVGGVAVEQREPLIAIRCHVAREGRVGGEELRVGQIHHVGEADEIVAIRPEAVEEDDEVAGVAAGGCAFGAGEECG